MTEPQPPAQQWDPGQAQWQQPAQPYGDQVAGGQPPYAGWGLRLGALLLDVLILVIPIVIVGVVLGAVIGGDGTAGEDEGAAAGLIITVLSVVLPYLYYGATMGRQGDKNGQSIGKQVVGIRVVREDGNPVGFLWAMLRELVKGVLGTFTLLINYLWPLWDKKNQAQHDKVKSDLVVRT